MKLNQELKQVAMAVGGTYVGATADISDAKLKAFHTEAFAFLSNLGFKKPDAGDCQILKLGNGVSACVGWRDGRTEYSFDVDVRNSDTSFNSEWYDVTAGASSIERFKKYTNSVLEFAKRLSTAMVSKPSILV
jgi:hypothetical protein